VDPIRRQDEVAVVQIVLFWSENLDRPCGLLSRVGLLLGANRCCDDE
jgi:hypothetical protein